MRAPAARSGGAAGVSHHSPRAHTKIQREDTQRGKKRTNFAAGQGKKSAKFWAVQGKGCPAGRAVPGKGSPGKGGSGGTEHDQTKTLKRHTNTHKHTQTHNTHNTHTNTHKHKSKSVWPKSVWPKSVLAKVGHDRPAALQGPQWQPIGPVAPIAFNMIKQPLPEMAEIMLTGIDHEVTGSEGLRRHLP